MDVLGIEVETSLARRWAGWLAPARQPFFLTAAEAAELGLAPELPPHDLSAELRDTYEVWNLAHGLEVVWLDDEGFTLSRSDVRAGARRGAGRGTDEAPCPPSAIGQTSLIRRCCVSRLTGIGSCGGRPSLSLSSRQSSCESSATSLAALSAQVGAGGDLARGRARTSPCPRAQSNLRHREQRKLLRRRKSSILLRHSDGGSRCPGRKRGALRSLAGRSVHGGRQ